MNNIKIIVLWLIILLLVFTLPIASCNMYNVKTMEVCLKTHTPEQCRTLLIK